MNLAVITSFDIPDGLKQFFAKVALGIPFHQFFFSQRHDRTPWQSCAEYAQEEGALQCFLWG
jgi:hypothetical protein